MRASMLALVAVLTSCASTTPPTRAADAPNDAVAAVPAPTTKQPHAGEPKASDAVLRTLTRVSKLRQLASTRAVASETLAREAMVRRIKEKALRELPPEAIRREGQILVLLGFAEPSFDYLRELMTLLDSQLEGFYEPKTKTMVLAEELSGEEAEATLAHELVHALQDQHWDLASRSTYRPGRSDETMALGCLAEGDATSAMLDFVFQKQQLSALDVPDETVRSLMAASANTPSVQKVPHILRSTLISPYVDGLAFIHALRRDGGWALVDKVWSDPPKTTEHVLHPEKWRSKEPALVIDAPTGVALGNGWTRTDEDTLGELTLALTFEEWLPEKDARLAASGWGGDRTAMYARGDEIAFMMHTRFDEAQFAERAFNALRGGLKKTLRRPTRDESGVVCFERAELGPLLLARNGAELILAAGPARTGGARWASTATCKTALAWARENLKAPSR